MSEVDQKKRDMDKKGSVLLLTLIITMIILTSSVVLGTLIIGSLRRSQEQSTSIVAFYAAESLMEKTLYDLRKNKFAPSQIKIIDGACPSILGAPASYSCKVDIPVTTPIGSGVLFGTINKNQKIQFKLFDPTGDASGAEVEKLEFRCSSIGSPWLEVTASVISAGGTWISDPASNSPKKYLFSCTSSSPDSIANLETDKSYNIEIKALYNNATSVYVKALKVGGLTQVSLSDYYEIVASVDYSAFSRQSIKVQISGASTVSSIFDNVLYSEQAITKDIVPGSS